MPYQVRVDQFPSPFQVDVLSPSPLIFSLLAFASLSFYWSEEGRARGSISDLPPSLGRVSRLRVLLSVVCEGVCSRNGSVRHTGTGGFLVFCSRYWFLSRRGSPTSLIHGPGGALSFVPSTIYIPSRTLAPASLQGRSSFSDT